MVAFATVALASILPKTSLNSVTITRETDESVMKEHENLTQTRTVILPSFTTSQALNAAGDVNLKQGRVDVSSAVATGFHTGSEGVMAPMVKGVVDSIHSLMGSSEPEASSDKAGEDAAGVLKQRSKSMHLLEQSESVESGLQEGNQKLSSLIQGEEAIANESLDTEAWKKTKEDAVAKTNEKVEENKGFVGPHGGGENLGASIIIGKDREPKGPAGTIEDLPHKNGAAIPKKEIPEFVGNGQYCGNPGGSALLCLKESLCLNNKQKPCGEGEPEKVCKCYETAAAVVAGDEKVEKNIHGVAEVVPPIDASEKKSPLRSMFKGYYGVMVVAFLICLTLILLSRGGRRNAPTDTPTMLEEWRTFLNCPKQLRLALMLTFIDSIRFYAGVSAMPLLLSNEYGFSDSAASAIAAHCVLVAVIFGFGGAYFVDKYDSIVGISRLGTSMSFISRMILVFWSSGVYGNAICLVCTLFLFPFVEGCLGPSFRTAIVRLSTDETRSFNFAMLYATQSLGGAFGFMIVDLVKDQVHTVGTFTMSGIRYAFFLSGILMGVAAIFSIFLRDERLEEELTPETPSTRTSVTPTQGHTGMRSRRDKKKEKAETGDVEQQQRKEEEEEEALVSSDSSSSSWDRSNSKGNFISLPVAKPWYSSINELFRSSATKKVLTFSILTTFTCTQWQFSETLLPKFLTRIHGTSVPWGSISSLNMWGCVFGPPIAAAVFSEFEDFDVIIPGIVLFALSPLSMVASDSHLVGSVLWMILMTIGEVIWSPRFQAYAASLCPPNQQAMFLTLVAMPRILFSWIGTLMGGVMLDMFVPPCPQCADEYGFFCDTLSEGGCKSSVSGLACGNPNQNQFCAPTCQDCPGWTMESQTMWFIILGISVVSPILIAYNRDYFGSSLGPERMALKIKASKI